MSFFSLLISYRDRDTKVLEACLESFANQTFQGFEICFLDYGSSPTLQIQVKDIAQRFDKVRYFVTQTEGFFWNKAKALNFLLQQARHEQVVIIDVDLVFSPNFLEVLYQHTQKGLFFLNYAATFLTKEQGIPPKRFTPLNSAQATYSVGYVSAPTADFKAVGGFDEFYTIWGVEDLDILQRIAHHRKQEIYAIPSGETQAWHVWHETNQVNLPKHWYKFLYHHYFKVKKQQNFIQEKNFLAQETNLFTMKQRPILAQRQENNTDLHHYFNFQFPFLRSISLFYAAFQQLPAQHYLIIKQNFDGITTPIERRTWKQTLVQYINQFWQKIGISYRITEIACYETELLSGQEVKDFLFYFIHHFQEQVQDYYYYAKGDYVECWILKKA